MKRAIAKSGLVVAVMAAAACAAYAQDANCWQSDMGTLIGIKASTPQRMTLSLSSFFQIRENFPSLLLQVEPGYGGGKFNVGIGGACAGIVPRGGALKASLLRTWNDPVSVPNNQTYLGAELELMLCFINGSIGAYRRIDGRNGDDWIVSAGVGIGF